MKNSIFLQFWALMAGFALIFAGRCCAENPATRPADFKVFDNMFNPHKPDLVSEGFQHCNIVYSGRIWAGDSKSPDFGKMPDEAAFKAAVKKVCKLDGPIVLDCETLRLSGKPEVAEPHFKLFIALAKWTHEAMPGHVVGYYGHGLFPEMPGKDYAQQAAQLVDAVDAFFPSMYTFSEDREAWKTKAAGLLDQAHKIAPGKPVYFYLWPQFHEGSKPAALSLTTLSGEQWDYELNTSRELGADGVVFWSGSKSPAWDVNAPWWISTQDFIKRLK